MKTKNIALLLSLLALLPAGAVAQEAVTARTYQLPPVSVTPENMERGYLDSYSREAGTLYPVEITVPRMSKLYAGNYVDLLFTVGADGRPKNVGVTSGSPETGFVMPILDALNEWRFSPVMRDGVAVPTKASLHVWYGSAGADPTAAKTPAIRTAGN